MTPRDRAVTVTERARRIVLAEPEQLEPLIAAEIHEALRELLDRVGLPCICKGCGKAIWFVRHHQSGKLCPYDADGTTHFATCKNAADFRADPRNRKPK